jgi:DNA-binding NtrC family response regulator
MERLTILAPNGWIDDVAVRTSLEQMDSRDHSSENAGDTEAEQIRRVLAATNGKRVARRRSWGSNAKTLYRKLERMGHSS